VEVREGEGGKEEGAAPPKKYFGPEPPLSECSNKQTEAATCSSQQQFISEHTAVAAEHSMQVCSLGLGWQRPPCLCIGLSGLIKTALAIMCSQLSMASRSQLDSCAQGKLLQ